MATTASLEKRLIALEALMKEVIRSTEIATRAYAENREPFTRQVATTRAEIRARFDGLDKRLMKLEGRE
jgi:hypothetical protein